MAREAGILAEAPDGSLWYTDIHQGVIGQFDPQTGRVSAYPLNEPGVRAPHTPILDKRSGQLFSSLQSGHVGHLTLVSSATVIKPYALTQINDVIWYSEPGVRPNRLVRFDPQTEHFQTFAIPSGCGVLRHFEATAQGNIVTAGSGVNRSAGRDRRAVREPRELSEARSARLGPGSNAPRRRFARAPGVAALGMAHGTRRAFSRR